MGSTQGQISLSNALHTAVNYHQDKSHLSPDLFSDMQRTVCYVIAYIYISDDSMTEHLYCTVFGGKMTGDRNKHCVCGHVRDEQ